MSILPPHPSFSFASAPGNAVHKDKPVKNCIPCRKRKTKCDRLTPCTPCRNRDEADKCERLVKETSDRPVGYTHVSDTSILANRVAQLEQIVSRLVARLDTASAYEDIIHNFAAPYPIYRPAGKEDLDKTEDLSYRGISIDPQRKSLELVDPLLGGFNGRETEDVHGTGAGSTLRTLSDMRTSSIQPLSDTLSAQTLPQVDMGQDDVDLSMTQGIHNVDPFEAIPDMDPAYVPDPSLMLGKTDPMSKAPSVDEHEAFLTLEGMALGRNYLPDPPTVSAHSNDGRPSPETTTFMSLMREKRPHEPTARRSFPPAELLPSAIVGKYLVEHYFNTANHLWRCVHRPTLERTNNALLITLRASKVPDLCNDELFSLALYSACIAVGVSLLEADGYHDLRLSQQEGSDIAKRCWQVSYNALEAADWMQNYNIKSCQTILVIGLYLSSMQRANHYWTLLGVANKIAMSLGLATIPSEQDIEASKTRGDTPPRWANAIEREVGRRVWFCLVENDWLFAMEHNFLFTIGHDMYSTTEPSHVDDLDITESSVVRSVPLDSHTDMSYFVQRLKVFWPLRDLIRSVRKTGRMRYQFVQDAHSAISKCIEERPGFYRPQESLPSSMDAAKREQILLEKEALVEGTNLRFLRIHRYYFPESCVNRRYILTKDACISSAKQILEPGDGKARPLIAQFWAHAYATLTASVIILIYVQHAPTAEIEEWKGLAEAGIARLKFISQSGRTSLGDSAQTLQTLLRVQLDRRSNQPTSEPVPVRSKKRSFEQVSSSPGSDFDREWLNTMLDPHAFDAIMNTIATPGNGATLNDVDMTSLLQTWLRDVGNEDNGLGPTLYDGFS